MVTAEKRPDAPERTAEREMIDWIRARIRDRPACQLAELRESLIAHFSHQQGFLQRYFRESFEHIAYDLVQRAVAKTRDRLVLGDEVVDGTELAARAAKRQSKWALWMEHSGDRHIRLLSMRRADLDRAIAERKARGDGEYRVMAVLVAIRKRMPDGDSVVSDVVKIEDIDEIERSVVVKVTVKTEKGQGQ